MTQKDANFTNIIILLIGFVLILIGLLTNLIDGEKIFKIDVLLIQSILISVGTSIIASGLISLLLVKYIYFYQGSLRNIVDEWGMRRIDIRSNINPDINKKLDSMDIGMDIIAFGMRNFLSVQGDLLIEKLNRGCRIRILTITPNSPFVRQREIDELEMEGQIKNSIDFMIKWAKTAQGNLTDKGLISVKTYSGLPQDMYQKVDDYVYIGPFLYGKPSQQTIAYSFAPKSKGAEYYTSYFNKLWSDDNFSTKVL